MNTEFLKDLGLGFLFVLSQVVFFQHLSLFGATADPLLFFLVWIISRHERIQMLFLAAILGLIQDGFLDFWGMFMFSKTLIIFLSYTFIKKRSENQLLLWQIFVVIFVVAIAHSIILLGLSSFFSIFAHEVNPFVTVFANAFYTAALGTVFYILRD